MKIPNGFRGIGPIMVAVSVVLVVVVNGLVFAENTAQDVDYEAGFYYTVKKGDTLWDLSQRFDDTPWVWPDLWKENAQLPNPHWIYPGQRIRLFRKSDKQRHQISQTQKAVPAITPQVEASPIPEKSAPEVHYYYSSMDQVGFIRKPAVQPSGVIFKSLDNKELISTHDTVYIRHPDGGQPTNLVPGSRWTVYKTLAPSDTRDSENAIGTQHYLLGILEVVQNEGQYAIGKILKSYRDIRIGNLLMPYQKQSSDVTVVDSAPDMDAAIINSEEHRQLIGSLFTVFIDKGATDGILPGQLYNVYFQETAPIGAGGEQVALNPVVVGNLIVLHTEETTSTGLITDVNRKISAEDRVKTP
jgi:hypothetical protein